VDIQQAHIQKETDAWKLRFSTVLPELRARFYYKKQQEELKIRRAKLKRQSRREKARQSFHRHRYRFAVQVRVAARRIVKKRRQRLRREEQQRRQLRRQFASRIRIAAKNMQKKRAQSLFRAVMAELPDGVERMKLTKIFKSRDWLVQRIVENVGQYQVS